MRRGRSLNTPLRAFERARDAQELGAVGHFDRLDENLAGLAEGGMDRQLRTAAAEAALRKTLAAGPAEAVAGIVDLQHEERHARRARPLQHGQPVRRLLEGDAEARAQHVDVVAGAVGGRVERLIGHHQRVRGVAAELEAGEPAGFVGRQLQAPGSRPATATVMRIRQASIATSRNWSNGDRRSDRNRRCEWRS